jgi:5-methylcytosine-specific restriction protein B
MDQAKSRNLTPSNWTQTYPFRCEMKPGDIVIVPYGNTAFRAIAEITGDYYFVPEAEGYYAHRRPVRWLLTLDEPLPLDTIIDGNFTMRTLYSIATSRVNIPALGRLLSSTENLDNSSDVKGQPEQFVLIIDEINRANISKVFGELITLIEPDKRLGMPDALTVTLPYSKKKDFGIPANLHIIGTMNTADRSIALLDTALRRRFNFREMAPDATLLSEVGDRSQSRSYHHQPAY